jgi:hypothetical protein
MHQGPAGRTTFAPPSTTDTSGFPAVPHPRAASPADAPTMMVHPVGPTQAGPAQDGSTQGGPALAGPPPAGPAGAPPTDQPARRRRVWLAAVAALAVLLGGGAATAVISSGGDDPAAPDTQAQVPQAGIGENPGQVAPPEPSGVAGLGLDPSSAASATPTPGAGFRPFSAPRKTLPGASLHLKSGESFSDALRRSDRTYGPLRMVRVFYPGLPPKWNGSRADEANRTVVVSFKAPPREVSAGKHDARLRSWFASVPKNLDVYWSYFHEPENDVQSGSYTPAQFAAAFRHVSGLADSARNPRLRATLILMCWTLNPSSGRDFNAYYPGSAAVDVLGWDCYNSGLKSNRYTAPAQVFSRMINKSKALGKPWGLAETGSTRISSDKTGSGRAAWIKAMSKYLNEQKPVWVAYYDYKVDGGDFRLTDTASMQAWKAWCSASPT